MKINNLFIVSLCLFFALNFSSCKKEIEPDITNTETPKAAITISSPQESKMYMAGDTVFINATATCETTMHGYEIFIRNKSMNDSLYFHKQFHDHNTNITISDFWVNNVAEQSDMELELRMVMDHEGTTQSEKRAFHCMP